MIRKGYLIPIKKAVVDIRKGAILRTYYVRPEYLEEQIKKFLGQIGKPLLENIPNLPKLETSLQTGNPQQAVESFLDLAGDDVGVKDFIYNTVRRFAFEDLLEDTDIYLQDLLHSILGFIVTVDKKYVGKIRSVWGKLAKDNDYVVVKWVKTTPVYETVKVGNLKLSGGGKDLVRLFWDARRLQISKGKFLIAGTKDAIKYRLGKKSVKKLVGNRVQEFYKVVPTNNAKVVGNYLGNFLAFYNPHFTKLDYLVSKFVGSDFVDKERILVNVRTPIGGFLLSPTDIQKSALLNALIQFVNDGERILLFQFESLPYVKKLVNLVLEGNPRLHVKLFLRQYDAVGVIWNARLVREKYPAEFYQWLNLPEKFGNVIRWLLDYSPKGIKRILELPLPSDLKGLYLALMPTDKLLEIKNWLIGLWKKNPRRYRWVATGVISKYKDVKSVLIHDAETKELVKLIDHFIALYVDDVLRLGDPRHVRTQLFWNFVLVPFINDLVYSYPELVYEWLEIYKHGDSGDFTPTINQIIHALCGYSQVQTELIKELVDVRELADLFKQSIYEFLANIWVGVYVFKEWLLGDARLGKITHDENKILLDALQKFVNGEYPRLDKQMQNVVDHFISSIGVRFPLFPQNLELVEPKEIYERYGKADPNNLVAEITPDFVATVDPSVFSIVNLLAGVFNQPKLYPILHWVLKYNTFTLETGIQNKIVVNGHVRKYVGENARRLVELYRREIKNFIEDWGLTFDDGVKVVGYLPKTYFGYFSKVAGVLLDPNLKLTLINATPAVFPFLPVIDEIPNFIAFPQNTKFIFI